MILSFSFFSWNSLCVSDKYSKNEFLSFLLFVHLNRKCYLSSISSVQIGHVLSPLGVLYMPLNPCHIFYNDQFQYANLAH